MNIKTPASKVKQMSLTQMKLLNATIKEAEDAGLINDNGVALGAAIDEHESPVILKHDGNEHILAVSPSRSSDIENTVIPTLLDWPESVFLLDKYGDIYEATAEHRKLKNHEVMRISPFDNNSSASWNPLDDIRLDTPNETPDSLALADCILEMRGKHHDGYWAASTTDIFASVILHTLYKRRDEGRAANLNEIYKAIYTDNETFSDTLKNSVLNKSLSKETVEYFDSVDKAGIFDNDNVEQSFLIIEPYLKQLIAPDNVNQENTYPFRMGQLTERDRFISLYYTYNPCNMDVERPFMRLFINMLNAVLIERDQVRDLSKDSNKCQLLCMVNEFTILKKLSAIESIIMKGSARNIKLYLQCTDVNEINNVKNGHEIGSIIDENCCVKLFYNSPDHATKEYISKHIGIDSPYNFREDEVILLIGNHHPFALRANLISNQSHLISPKNTMAELC